MILADQPTSRPTNKALAMLGGFVITTPQILPIVQEVWPQIAPAVLAGPAFTDALAAVIAGGISLAVAWFVPDQPNVPR